MSELNSLSVWPWQTQALQQALDQLNGHAALLHGAPGTGQFEFAMAVAGAWLCEASEPAQGVARSRTMACGQCVSCRLIAARSHPDLMVVLPEALQAPYGWSAQGANGEGEADSDRATGSGGKAKKLSTEIKVDVIREVVLFSQQTSSRGRCKVVVLYPADALNMVAANTLLKTLEEPPGMVRFVLGADALDTLLPTVRSRCQAWRLPALDVDSAAHWLCEELPQVSDADARVLLNAAGGQPLTARQWHGMGIDSAYWQQLPKELAAGQGGKWASWPLVLQVQTLQKLCHDLACCASGAMPRYFPPECLPRPPSLNRLTAWAVELRKAQRHADHPWHAVLKTETLLRQTCAVLRVKT